MSIQVGDRVQPILRSGFYLGVEFGTIVEVLESNVVIHWDGKPLPSSGYSLPEFTSMYTLCPKPAPEEPDSWEDDLVLA